METFTTPILNSKEKRFFSKEWREKISKSKKGKKLSEEHKKKLSLSHKGQKAWNKGLKGKQVAWNKGIKMGKNPAMSERMKGNIPWNKYLKGFLAEELSPHWKGNEVGYNALHSWVTRYYGQPKTCEHCQKTGLTGHKIHWANKSGEYRREREDWLRLCAKCHRQYDIQNGLIKSKINHKIYE